MAYLPARLLTLALMTACTAAMAPSTASASPPDTLSIPVTPEQEQREVRERERLNREQAEFGTRQLAENEANRLAYEQAVRDRDATIARQKAEYEAQVAAVEAERLRLEREHAARRRNGAPTWKPARMATGANARSDTRPVVNPPVSRAMFVDGPQTDDA